MSPNSIQFRGARCTQNYRPLIDHPFIHILVLEDLQQPQTKTTMNSTSTIHLPSCSTTTASRLGLASQTNNEPETFRFRSEPHPLSQAHQYTQPGPGELSPSMDQVSLLELLMGSSTWPRPTHTSAEEMARTTITPTIVSFSRTSSTLTSILDAALQDTLSVDEFCEEEITRYATSKPLPRQ